MDQETSLLLRHNFSKIYLLFGCDALLLPILFFTASESPGLITGIIFAVHCFLVIWVALILRWIGQVTEIELRNTLILYWVSFVLSVLSIGVFLFALWLIAALVIKKARQRCQIDISSEGWEENQERPHKKDFPGNNGTIPGSVWPLFVSLLFVIASMAQAILMIGCDLSEFGALGIFFVILFSTPFLLLIPGLLRIPAAADVKKSIILAQYMTYFMVIMSWLIFFFRQM